MYVTDIDDGEYIRLRGVDFQEKGAKQMTVCAAATGRCNLTIRLDSAEGPLIGTVKIQPTRSLDNYRSFTAKVKNAYGVHDLYLCFDQCTKEVHLDWWSFK